MLPPISEPVRAIIRDGFELGHSNDVSGHAKFAKDEGL